MNRNEHDLISLLAGTPAGVAAAQPRTGQDLLLSSLLGGVGAIVGGRGPDGLEPATSPRHRGPGHSVLAAAVVLAAANEMRRMVARNTQWTSLERALAGAFVSACVAYAAHIGADATTPLGVRLIG